MQEVTSMSAPSEESVPLRAKDSDEDALPAPLPAARSSRLDTVVLHETPGHLLRRAQQRAGDVYVRAVGDDGLRSPQFAVLLTVYQNPGLNQTALVRRTGIDRSTIGDMISRLVRRGLLARKRTRADQRANTLWITADGVAALERTLDAAMAAQDEIMAPIPADRRDAVVALLKLLADLPEDGFDK
jgi:DNA-binding MarR family transcriptional regulator